MMRGLVMLLAAIWRLAIVQSSKSQANPSIMDLVNPKIIQKFLLNETIGPSHLDGNYIAMDHLPDLRENALWKPNRKPKANIPDISSVLMDRRGFDKLLKPDPTSLQVGRKDIVRKDWCVTEPVIQRIREEGCVPKTIVNRFCYGQCNSFYIPKNLNPRRGKKKRVEEDEGTSPSFRSCGVCKPKKTTWVQVHIHCPGMTPPFKKRRVLKIKECQCLAENIM